MCILGTTVLRNMSFSLTGQCEGYEVYSDKGRVAMNKIVAKNTLRITTMKRLGGVYDVSKSIDLTKEFITGHDVANALVQCEKSLRSEYGINDPDHCFFEGFLRVEPGSTELVCFRWGS